MGLMHEVIGQETGHHRHPRPEYAFGDMDFKVAGTRDHHGLQLDTARRLLRGAGRRLARPVTPACSSSTSWLQAIDAPDEMAPTPCVLAVRIPVDET